MGDATNCVRRRDTNPQVKIQGEESTTTPTEHFSNRLVLITSQHRYEVDMNWKLFGFE